MNKMKTFRRFGCALLAVLMLFCAVSCTGTKTADEAIVPADDRGIFYSKSSDEGTYAYEPGTASFDSVPTGMPSYDGEGVVIIDSSVSTVPEGVDVDGGDGDVAAYNEPKAGMLTAAEWKDLDNWDFWKHLVNDNNWYELIDNWGLWAKNRIVVRFGNDVPLDNVPVSLVKADGTVVYRAVSDRNGNAYLFYTDKEAAYAISYVVGGNTVTMDWDGSETVNVDAAGSKNKLALDLMFMVDTTGSMGDELTFLKAELADVITQVKTSLQIPVRTSVNFYRDTEDDYIVRPFEFTTDLTVVQSELSAQSSDGGGDYPEAVHTALGNAVNEHDWAENSVKLLFLVLDAPAHDEATVKAQLQKTIDVAAATGIRIIPVASSGVDQSSEALFRSFAVLTGGTYVFLTNDSGIGGDHLEATVGEHEVEKLNDLLVRVISEYCNGKTE